MDNSWAEDYVPKVFDDWDNLGDSGIREKDEEEDEADNLGNAYFKFNDWIGGGMLFAHANLLGSRPIP